MGTTVFIIFICCCYAIVNCEGEKQTTGRELVEQGRTFIHHAVKRFMIILPAIFFKLGIAFTLLVLVTLVAVNNGFIGFLLLVVGVSSVLARLQEARRPAFPIPIAYERPHHHLYDRSDNLNSIRELNTIKGSAALHNYNQNYNRAVYPNYT